MADSIQQPRLEQLFEAGRAAWPALPVTAEEFASFVAPEVAARASTALAGDLFLACACRLGRAEGLAAFERELLAHVPAYLARVEGAGPFVEEVRQLLRIRLFVAAPGEAPKIVDYRAKGPLGAWVRVVAINLALELQRAVRTNAEPMELEGLPQLVATPNPELDYLRVRYGAVFRRAFAASLEALEPRERTVLKLHLVHGLSIDKIAQVYQAHRSSAARWLVDVRERLYDETRRRVLEGLSLAPAELDSLLTLLRSEIDVSVRRLLTSSEAPPAT